MTPETEASLRKVGLDPVAVAEIVERTLTEDLGPDRLDVTSVATIPDTQVDAAELVVRAPGVVAGLAVAAAVFEAVSPAVEVSTHAVDGSFVVRGTVLATITGPTRALLTAERSALNLLCRMSGVATHTRQWADLLDGTKALVLDTRKTTPGLRILEKYAVRAGGGTNKRMGLYDVAMIKDNHKLAAGGISAAYRPGPLGLPRRPGAGRGHHGRRGRRGGHRRRDVPAAGQHVARPAARGGGGGRRPRRAGGHGRSDLGDARPSTPPPASTTCPSAP